jgi:hypothetical protein
MSVRPLGPAKGAKHGTALVAAVKNGRLMATIEVEVTGWITAATQ